LLHIHHLSVAKVHGNSTIIYARIGYTRELTGNCPSVVMHGELSGNIRENKKKRKQWKTL